MLHIGKRSQSFKQCFLNGWVHESPADSDWICLGKIRDPSFLTSSQGMEVLLVQKPWSLSSSHKPPRRGEMTLVICWVQTPGFCVRVPTERTCPFSCRWLRQDCFLLKHYLQATDWFCILILIISCIFISVLVGTRRKRNRDN